MAGAIATVAVLWTSGGIIPWRIGIAQSRRTR
jgi:hypothetical protein